MNTSVQPFWVGMSEINNPVSPNYPNQVVVDISVPMRPKPNLFYKEG